MRVGGCQKNQRNKSADSTIKNCWPDVGESLNDTMSPLGAWNVLVIASLLVES